MPKKRQSVHFEKSIDELETIVEQLETGELSLEESLKAFEKGVALTRQCQQALDDAEKKVEILTGTDADSGVSEFTGETE